MREYTKDMGEISGFGGGYEEACRKMVLAGLDWFDANPDADPQFHGYEGIYGIITEDNDDAKVRSPLDDPIQRFRYLRVYQTCLHTTLLRMR